MKRLDAKVVGKIDRRAMKSDDPKLLALRLEARWNDARAAYDRLKVAEATAKADLKERKEAIDAIESAIASLLREEDHDDAEACFKRAQEFRAKADKREKALDNASKRHKTEISKRRSALEQLLGSDLSQLPLLLPDMSVVTDIHVEGELLLVGDPVHLKGLESVLYVKGFRTEGEGKSRSEIVVVEDDEGNTIDSASTGLSRPKKKTKGKNSPRLPPKTKAAAKAKVEPGGDFGGFVEGDAVSHKVNGTVGRVVAYSTNSSRLVVVWDGTDKSPKEVPPSSLELIERAKKKPRRIGFKLGDRVEAPGGKPGKIVEIVSRDSVEVTGGARRSFPGRVKVLLEGARSPKEFHATGLTRRKKTK